MNVFSIISPLIIIALTGYISTKTKWLSKEQLDAISKFAFSLCIPAFLFYQMSKANFSEQISLQFFAAFYLPVLICYLITWLISYFFYKEKPCHPEFKRNSKVSLNKNSGASAVFALGASFSNTVIVGLPVLLATMGEQVISIVFLIVTFHSTMLFALTGAITAWASSKGEATKFNWLDFTKKTLNNPLIISILSGLAVNMLGIALPDFLQDSLALMSKPAIPLALFILGASLAFYQIRQELTFISIASINKLILLPMLVFIASQYLFKLEPLVVTVLVILSACPTGVSAYLIAATHQQHQKTVAGTVVLSTLACIITIPLWLNFIL